MAAVMTTATVVMVIANDNILCQLSCYKGIWGLVLPISVGLKISIRGLSNDGRYLCQAFYMNFISFKIPKMLF